MYVEFAEIAEEIQHFSLFQAKLHCVQGKVGKNDEIKNISE
jgi:hypothetical protein